MRSLRGSFEALLSLILFLAFDGLTVAPAAVKETVLYSFAGQADGQEPFGTLLADKRGDLFGTTHLGGTGNCTNTVGSGCGTVFELSPQAGGGWTETVLHSFQGGSDGQSPQALLMDVRGNLYGVTGQGGSGNCANRNLAGCGTVFELSPNGDSTWSESVLYNFQGVPSGNGNGDAAGPNSLVFDTSGKLYGFTSDGGHCVTQFGSVSCDGAAFELYRHAGTWSEKVIYRADDSTAPPGGATFDDQGNLYGSSDFAGPETVGEVFRLIPPSGKGTWTAQVLYSFLNESDGAFPAPGFVFDAVGNLYGATGGSDSVASNIFELSPTDKGAWTESVVFSFIDEGVDVYPAEGPIMTPKGNLYGATGIGGATGNGLVYKVSKKNGAWSGKALYDFTGGNDGTDSLGGLVIGKDGVLYGTTAEGGVGSCQDGCGTVFRITP